MKKSKITDIELRIERSILGRSVKITEENSQAPAQCFIVAKSEFNNTYFKFMID